MRKNVKQQLALRVLSTAALMAMVSSIATAAFADTYDLNKGSVDILAEGGEQRITQWEDKDNNLCVKDGEGKEIRNRLDDDITLTTKDETTGETKTTDVTETTGETGETETTGEIKTTTNTITVEAKAGNTANVTLRDVNITKDTWSSGSAAMTIKGEGNTEIELDGKNTLISGRGHAGLEKADDVSTGSLTIKDDLNDNGTEKRKDESDTVGSLNVVGRGGSAAIGGCKKEDSRYDDTCRDTSNIKITGGCIKAGPVDENREYYTDMRGEYNCGAGIGGASSYGDAKNITITGNADVTAAGGYYSAGIGGGEYGNATGIMISGNAKVTASGSGSGGAGIGGGDEGMGKDIFITGNADVTAYGGNQGAGIGGGSSRGGSVTISGNAAVTAVGANGGAGIGAGASKWTPRDGNYDTTVDISKNANVTAVGSSSAAAIGTGSYAKGGKTTITITGGTVTAIGGTSTTPASAIGGGTPSSYAGKVLDVTVTINGNTGNTTVNASCQPNMKSAISTGGGADDIIGYDENGKSPFGEKNSVIVRMYNNGSYPDYSGDFKGDLDKCDLGTLYQTVHNRKYMEENPNIDTKKLEDEDLHDWKLVGKVVEPTLEKDGYADYVCSIDKCGQTKHVVLPKLTPEPSEPDVPGGNTPDTPNKPDTPKQPDGTTPAPVTPDVPSTPEVTPADPAVTPDAPAQDGTAPADTLTTDTTAAAQNVAQNAEPKAAASTAAALPQTGANWLAVVGSALSGLFLLAAGFVLDRKNRRMN